MRPQSLPTYGGAGMQPCDDLLYSLCITFTTQILLCHWLLDYDQTVLLPGSKVRCHNHFVLLGAYSYGGQFILWVAPV